jgi:hypothetical protein
MALFRKKEAPRRQLPPLPQLDLALSDDTVSGWGSHHELDIHGFDVELPSGDPLHPSEDGPVADRVFFFRVAGVSHYLAAQSDSFVPMAQVFLQREPNNPHDPMAIQVLGHDLKCAGYVPANLAVQMSALLDAIGGKGTLGIVTKTYVARGSRNAIEVVAAVERVVTFAGTVDDQEQDPGAPDDRWRHS